MNGTLLLIFCFLFKLIILNANDFCIFTDAKSGSKMDLTALAHSDIMYDNQDEDDPNTFIWTPCRNGDECKNSNNGTNTGMFIQRNNDNSNICHVAANWDNGDLQPTLSPDKQWIFIYENGDKCENTNTSLLLIINCDLDAGDYNIISAG